MTRAARRPAERTRRRILAALAALLVPGCVSPFDVATGDDAAGTVELPGLLVETELGAFTVLLYPDEAPQTVAFIGRLADAGYYDGREFSRVIPGFVIQEVDRTGGTTDQEERVPLEAGTRAMFSAGALGIARDADPDSGGSEFFVMDFAFSHLHGNYTVFGQVVEGPGRVCDAAGPSRGRCGDLGGGMDVVRRIARVPTVETGPASALWTPAGAPVQAGVHDRVAVDPVAMTRVARVKITMPREAAAAYPLVVGPTARAGDARATLEWPRDLAAGRTSTLAWYVYTAPGGPGPDLDGADVVARQGAREERFSFERDALDDRVLRWTWTPPAPGAYNVTLVNATGEIGFAEPLVAG